MAREVQGWLSPSRPRRRRGHVEARSLTRSDLPAAMFPTTSTGEPVAVRDSLTLVDAWAVVSVIARTAAQMPPVIYRRQGEGRVRVSEGLGPELLRRPSPGMTPSAFVASAILSVALWGEVLIGKFRRGEQVVMLGVLPPDAVEVARDSTGEVRYLWTDPTGQRHDLTRADVAHGLLFSLDGLRGVSPVRMCREGLGLNRALAQHAAATVANNGAPSGVVTIPEGPSADEVLENLRRGWSRHEGPANAGKVAFTTSSVTFAPIGMALADAQFLEQRQYAAAEVARIWGCPPWAIGAKSGDSLTYSTVAEQYLHLVRSCVTSHVLPLEEAISADEDLCPGDLYCELLAEGVLRGDTKSRYEAYEVGLRAGFLDVEEVRRAENLPARQPARPALSVVPEPHQAHRRVKVRRDGEGRVAEYEVADA